MKLRLSFSKIMYIEKE